ncbi:TMEM165/GDT1 family protein [Porticoccus sp. W117]|uniref:TMEM165/GDT1 family protein n=1 Tax=Porticoccus sp. W117 TaxID=3054777 RepID=UPI002591CBAE|nr:TMEM165/GDT1 family protein [Porticoccus sp. W117]MDM3871902.1 TMEM165/GDT1 family protein [Porticoccus sp. W117]
MDWKVLLTIFGLMFVAELGDKSQVATLLFAADKEVNRWLVFVVASLALVAATGIGVLAGSALSHWFNPKLLGIVAGSGFIVIGVLTLIRGLYS